VNALTDVTGFGLLGHLCEMAQGSNLSAEIYFDKIPVLDKVDYYLQQNCIPGGTKRNWASYGHHILGANAMQINILCDPQTSGGLLVAVNPDYVNDFLEIAKKHLGDDMVLEPIGKLIRKLEQTVFVK
jgi:selenide,water dikinase